MPQKVVNIDIGSMVGENAFSLLGVFQKQALKEGWSKEEIDKVIGEATSDDYDHLCKTLMDQTVVGTDSDEFGDESISY